LRTYVMEYLGELLKQKVGELVMDLDMLKEATKANPLVRQMFDLASPHLPPSCGSACSTICTPPLAQHRRRTGWWWRMTRVRRAFTR